MEQIYRVQMNKNGMPNFSTAEPIVRCKECKMCQTLRRSDGKFYQWCHKNIREVKADGFCSYGQRAEQTEPKGEADENA